eukprot:scaffold635_cov311-Pinguiococcus_pyrenoidosus.AAC.12
MIGGGAEEACWAHNPEHKRIRRILVFPKRFCATEDHFRVLYQTPIAPEAPVSQRMKITVATDTDVYPDVDISNLATVAEVKQHLSSFVSRAAASFSLFYRGRILADSESVAQTFAGDADVLVQVVPAAAAPATGQRRTLDSVLVEAGDDPQRLMDVILRPENEHALRELRFRNAELGEAIQTRDVREVRRVRMKQILEGHKVTYDKQQVRGIWEAPLHNKKCKEENESGASA